MLQPLSVLTGKNNQKINSKLKDVNSALITNSQAVLVDKTLYISGQLGLDSQTGSLVPGGVEAEAKKALDNMGHILEAAGISYKNGSHS